MSMAVSNCVRGAILNEHSYSFSHVTGPCNVSLDHPYSAIVAEAIEGTETLEGIEYSKFRVPGDGNCFFSSLSVAINGNLSKSNHYRTIICTHIVENWELFKDLATVAHDLHSPLASTYIQLMLAKNGWGTVCEVKAACDVLHTNITVWLKGRANGAIHYTMNRYQPTENSHENISLLLWGDHYTPLIETDQYPYSTSCGVWHVSY